MKKLSTATQFLLAIALMGAVSCKKDKDDNTPITEEQPPSSIDGYGLGWFGEDDLGTTPSAVNFNFGDGNYPPSVDLVPKFPPIGDQGQYGTCVSWAVGYNIKTALSGMANNWGASDLSNPANISSAKDLFTAIPDANKGPDCNGTNFSFALDVVQSRGIASEQTVPYTNLGNCSQSNVQASWTSDAQDNKIEYWRKIDPTVESIKDNLSKNIPVILGAKLADNFMTWNSDNVISSGSSFNNVGQHAYHAMVIAGYDDSKGPAGAFKVINSWGSSWGDQGYIWVDYNYLINDFCVGGNGEKPLFIAANSDGNAPTPPDGNDPPVSSGVDLATWVFEDVSEPTTLPTERRIDFNIYNIGTQTASSSANWNIYYVYFNAYNANEYGVIFYDEINTSIPANTVDCPQENYCILNYNIPSGSDLAWEAFNDVGIRQYYNMPSITGLYYLAVVVDGDNAFQEQDEMNNVFYTTYYPKEFNNGYSKSNADKFEFKNELSASVENVRKNKSNSAVSDKYPNAYTTREITAFLKEEKRSGRLDEKLKKAPRSNKQVIRKP